MVGVGKIARGVVALLAGLVFSNAECEHESTQGPCAYDDYGSFPCESEILECYSTTTCGSCADDYNEQNDGCFASFEVGGFYTCDEFEDAVCCSVPSVCESNDAFNDIIGESRGTVVDCCFAAQKQYCGGFDRKS